MGKKRVEWVKYGIGGGVGPCGPGPGYVASEAKIQMEDGEISYFSLVDLEDFPSFYRTDESVLDKHLALDVDEDFLEKLNTECNIPLEGWAESYADENLEHKDVFLLLAAVTRLDYDETDALIQKARGKYIDEIDLPLTDIQRNALEDEELDEDRE